MAYRWSELNGPALIDTAVALGTAFVLGGIIGIERQYRQRNAGLRTNVLVAVGAAAFADLGGRVLGPEGAARVTSYVVSGIGFLGAGVIMKEGAQITGLNTAATLWGSAAVGAMAGCGFSVEAALVAGFVLAGNTLLRPVVDFINRRPITASATEATYRVHVVCPPRMVSEARDLLFSTIEAAGYPVRDVDRLSASGSTVELAAILATTTAEEPELDAIVEALKTHAFVESATWSVSATT